MDLDERLSPSQLDLILAVQLSVAWAGETGGDPPRLGWWQSDLVDEAAGGDLFGRLLPRTHAWAGLEAVRAAATRLDGQRREQLAAPDAARTLFHLGFRIDEQLRDRLRDHKRRAAAPSEALNTNLAIADRFESESFEAYLASFPKASTKVVPGGRLVSAAAASVSERVAFLAAALLPLAKAYPLPYFLQEGP